MAKAKSAAGYQESEDHVPNPTDLSGTYDTSGTAGSAHANLTAVTKVFDVAKANNLATAVAALDPKDATPEHLVTLHPDADPADVARGLKAAQKEAAAAAPATADADA